jgi:hypothetical protein
VPTDPSTATAHTTSRRRFLATTVVGGALVSSGVLAGSATGLLPSLPAGAEDLNDGDFAAFATPLELAAVQVCQAALDADVLESAWRSRVATVQTHHQAAADTIATLAAEDADPAAADTDFAAPIIAEISGASAQEAVLLAVANLEDTLSATHLLALGSIKDAVTARIVSQVLASEAQAAVVFGRGGGLEIEALTPAVATTEGGLEPGGTTDEPASDTTTTTTED